MLWPAAPKPAGTATASFEAEPFAVFVPSVATNAINGGGGAEPIWMGVERTLFPSSLSATAPPESARARRNQAPGAVPAGMVAPVGAELDAPAASEPTARPARRTSVAS